MICVLEALLAISLAIVLAIASTGPRVYARGVKDGRLAPCPDSPNCVSSQTTDERHWVEPLRVSGTTQEQLSHVRKAVTAMARTKVTTETDRYLHVEFSTFLGFVDDVEFLACATAGVVHVRSASRVGYWDLGVNRKRVEELRSRLGGRLA